MEELYRVLAELQANSAALNAQAWGYHWNTEGRMFKQDHAFLLEMYEDFGDAIDPFAENIRKIGYKAPFGLKQLLANSTIDVNDSHDLTSTQMFTELLKTNAQVIAQLKAGIKVAETANEDAISNFMQDRLGQHQFWNWQLTATLKSTIM